MSKGKRWRVFNVTLILALCVFTCSLILANENKSNWDDDEAEWMKEEDDDAFSSCGWICSDMNYLLIKDVSFSPPKSGEPCTIILNLQQRSGKIEQSLNISEQWPESKIQWSENMKPIKAAGAKILYIVNDDFSNKRETEMICDELTCHGSIPSLPEGARVRFAVVATDGNGNISSEGFSLQSQDQAIEMATPFKWTIEKAFRELLYQITIHDVRVTYDREHLYVLFKKADDEKVMTVIFSDPLPSGDQYWNFLDGNSITLDYYFKGMQEDASLEEYAKALFGNDPTGENKIDLITNSRITTVNTGIWLANITNAEKQSAYYFFSSESKIEQLDDQTFLLSIRRDSLEDKGNQVVRIFATSNKSRVKFFMSDVLDGCLFHIFYYREHSYTVTK